MENQFKSTTSATIGQLFDKAVDKVMNDQNFRKAMETSGSSYSWSCGQQQVCEIEIRSTIRSFSSLSTG